MQCLTAWIPPRSPLWYGVLVIPYLILGVVHSAFSQTLSFTSPVEATQMLNRLIPSVPSSVTILSVAYTGSALSSALYQDLLWHSNNVTVQIPNGIFLSSGGIPSLTNTATNFTRVLNLPGDSDLSTLLEAPTYDASSLTIRFSVTEAIQGLSFKFLFGSEEFPEYVGSEFNDGFGVFLNGQNITFDLLGRPITINSVFFDYNNTAQFVAGTTMVSFPIEYDGLTLVLTTQVALSPGEHTLKFVIADTVDHLYDSGVFIADLKFGDVCSGTGVPPDLSEIPTDVEVEVGETYVLPIEATHPDPNIDVHIFTSPTELPDNMTFFSNEGNPADALLMFSPTAQQAGETYEILIIAGSDNQVCDSAAIRFHVVSPAPPVAVNDNYATNLNSQLSVNPPGVLGNDNDPEGGALTAVLQSGPSHGNLNLNPDGSFTYTPGSNRCDAATFTYRARDPEGNLSNEATVTININPTDLTVTAIGMPDNDGTRVSATVRNSGTGTVLPGVAVKFYVGSPSEGGVLIGSANTTTPLAAGQSEEVVLTLQGVPFTSGNLITAVIDPDNTICETNENNNRMINEMVYTAEPYDLWAWTLPAPYLHPTGTLVGINTQTGKYRVFGIGLLDPNTGQPLDAEFNGIGMRGEDKVLFFMVTKRTGDGLSNNYTVYSVPSDNIQLNAQSYVSNLTQVREFARMSQSPATRSTTNSLCLGADDALYFVQFDEATGADRGLYRYRPGQGFIRKVASFAQGEGQFLGDIAFDPCNSPDGEGGGDLIGWGIAPNGEKRLFRIPSVLVYDADPTPRETIWRDYFPDWNSFSSPSGAGEMDGFTFDLFTLTPYVTHETGNGVYHYQRHQPDLRQLIPHTFTPFGRDLASEPEVRPFCPDTNRDSVVDDADLLNILFDFGAPPSGFRGRTDLNCDGMVDDIDLLNVLFRFGDIC